MPAFSYRHVKDLYPVFWKKSAELVEALMSTTFEKDEKNEDQKSDVVNIETWAARVALDIIGLAGMGQDFGSIQDEHSELHMAYRQMFTPTKSRLVLIFLSFLFPQWFLTRIPLDHNKNIDGGAAKIKASSRRLLDKRQENIKRGEKPTSKDILSVAMDAGIFSHEDLVYQGVTFLGAGHETSATTMMWAIYELSKSPEMQERLRKEVRANLPSVSDPSRIEAHMIEKCHYLAAVLNEVLRFHAPVSATVRQSVRETTLVGHRIPPKTHIVIPIRGMNLSVEQWGKDAGEFNPERWMSPGKSNDGGAASNYSFMTFIHGPRSCIASNFARTEILYVLAALIGRFQFELAKPDAPLEYRSGITVKPKHGMEVRLKVVSGW